MPRSGLGLRGRVRIKVRGRGRGRVRVRVRARVRVRVGARDARDGEVEVREEVVPATVVELTLEVDLGRAYSQGK